MSVGVCRGGLSIILLLFLIVFVLVFPTIFLFFIGSQVVEYYHDPTMSRMEMSCNPEIGLADIPQCTAASRYRQTRFGLATIDLMLVTDGVVCLAAHKSATRFHACRSISFPPAVLELSTGPPPLVAGCHCVSCVCVCVCDSPAGLSVCVCVCVVRPCHFTSLLRENCYLPKYRALSFSFFLYLCPVSESRALPAGSLAGGTRPHPHCYFFELNYSRLLLLCFRYLLVTYPW